MLERSLRVTLRRSINNDPKPEIQKTGQDNPAFMLDAGSEVARTYHGPYQPARPPNDPRP
jgi:hypothetical protein